jgi:hypothetical protein
VEVVPEKNPLRRDDAMKALTLVFVFVDVQKRRCRC